QHPSPAAESNPVNMIQNQARYGSPNYVGYGIASTEQGHRMGQVPLAKPVCQVEHNSWIVPSLGHPEEKAKRVQVERGLRKAGQDCHYSPTHQYSSDPHTCA